MSEQVREILSQFITVDEWFRAIEPTLKIKKKTFLNWLSNGRDPQGRILPRPRLIGDQRLFQRKEVNNWAREATR